MVFCVSFFLAPRIGAFFIFERCGTAESRALRSGAYRWECLYSQMDAALVSYGAKPYTFRSFFLIYYMNNPDTGGCRDY